jgi:hypothetical protein
MKWLLFKENTLTKAVQNILAGYFGLSPTWHTQYIHQFEDDL